MNALAIKPPLELSADQIEMIMSGSLSMTDALGIDRRGLMQIADIGYHALMNGAFENALKIFKGLVAVMPKDPVFNCYLAAAHAAVDSPDEALSFYGRALEGNPWYVDAWAGRGDLLLSLGRRGAGIADLTKVLELDPSRRTPSARRAASTLQILLRRVQAKRRTSR